MLVYLLQVYVLLTALMSQPVCGEACTLGWFGQSCRYMCHCGQSTPCEQDTGECPNNGSCTRPFFGPGCQFIDRVQLSSIQSTPTFLRDGNDSTCNPNPVDSSLELSLYSNFTMSWYRIVVNGSRSMLNFTTTLNGQPCSSEAHFQVAGKVVDVTCDVPLSFSVLRIDGSIAGSICSIYINQGRNVALQQHTSQSTTAQPYDLYKSNNAVDGNIDSNVSSGHCSQTNWDTDQAWIVTFHRPHILYTARIYNKNDFQYRLRGVKTETYDQNWALVMSNVDPSTSDWSIYSVPLFSPKPVTHVKVTQAQNFTDDDQVLTLCEVEIFGDSSCSNRAYGLSCEQSCQCNMTERCHILTGACAQGCPPGYYGVNCVQLCDVKCLQRVCGWTTGYCVRCIPGYKGSKCTTACNPGTFGLNCERNCSTGCASTCNNVDGKCVCKTEFTGDNCTECSNGYYGPGCRTMCSEGCNNVCDPVNGTCTCKTEYSGAYCTECSPGYYGPNCTNVCSERCREICDPVNGICLCRTEFMGDYCTECSPGYFGPNCANMCSKRCLKPCDPVDGKCVCKKEFTGEYCTECSPGYYGPNCASKCSVGCADICNDLTGRCLCKTEFTGVDCSECAATFYGAGCSSKCSRNCLDSVCDHMSGLCSSCAPGYGGDNCETGTGQSWILMLLFIPFLVLLPFFIQRRGKEEEIVEL